MADEFREPFPSHHIAYGPGRISSFVVNHAAIALELERSRRSSNALVNFDFETTGPASTHRIDSLFEGDAGILFDIDSLLDAEAKRVFDAWGPPRYPQREYPLPAAVRQGFEAYLARRAKTRQDTPVHDRLGSRFEYRPLYRDPRGARDAGRPIVFHAPTA